MMTSFAMLVALTTAQTPAIDLIPDNALGAVTFRNPAELVRKGEAWVKELDTPNLAPGQLGQFFAMAVNALGLNAIVDRDSAAAVVLLVPENLKKDAGFPLESLEQNIVVMATVKDPKDALKQAGAKVDHPSGKPFPSGQPQIGKFWALRDKHLYIAQHEKPLERILSSKKRTFGDNARRNLLAGDDLFLFVDSGWLLLHRSGDQADLKSWFTNIDDPHEKKLAANLFEVVKTIRTSFFGFRFDKGLGLHAQLEFAPDGPAKEFFTSFLVPNKHSHLAGLPEGKWLAAQAAVGDGSRTAALARLGARQFVEKIAGGEFREFTGLLDQPIYLGVFLEILDRVQGQRLAAYLSNDESKHGLLNVLAILDTEDADKFLTEMKSLAVLADPALLQKALNEPKATIDIAKLVADLGSNAYRTREAAKLRLQLIGEPALPYLAKGKEVKNDLELSHRASRLHDQISLSAEARRKDILKGIKPTLGRPHLTYFPKAETRAGRSVDIVQIALKDAEVGADQKLKQLFGPNWNQIRLVPHGQQVIVAIGSEPEFLDNALKNFGSVDTQLVNSPRFQPFREHADKKPTLQFHIGLGKILDLIGKKEIRARPGDDISSLGLTVETNRLIFDGWMPLNEFRRTLRAASP